MKLLALLTVFLLPAQAFALTLVRPIDCGGDRNCLIQNYVDHDPGPGVEAFNGENELSYNGHKGTDFRVPTEVEMRRGVFVLASAAGQVLRVRDGMDDISVKKIGLAAVKNRECGNGVVIAHEDGWETQYCHLRKGSLLVKPGQKVKQGEHLGFVGESGEAEFPHVHLQVSRKGQIIDPMTGVPFNVPLNQAASHPGAREMFDPPEGICACTHIYTGFVGAAAAKDGGLSYANHHDSLTPTRQAPALIFEALLRGIRKGYTVRMTLEREGTPLKAKAKIVAPTNYAQFSHFVGLVNKGDLFDGTFVSTISVTWPDGTVAWGERQHGVMQNGIWKATTTPFTSDQLKEMARD